MLLPTCAGNLGSSSGTLAGSLPIMKISVRQAEIVELMCLAHTSKTGQKNQEKIIGMLNSFIFFKK